LSVFSCYFDPTPFPWNSVHSVMVLLVFPHSYQSLLFNENIDKLLGRFLDLLLKTSFVCISESRDVSCWGCNANSTRHSNAWNLLLTKAVDANDLAQKVLRRFTQCRWIGHTTIQLRGGHSATELSPPQQNLLRQCPGVRWCYDM